MLTRVAALLALLAASLSAQSTCPSVNFLSARTVNLKPSPTTHIDVVRQSDGSYTGFEVTDAAPYRLIESTPHFERQFAACIPHTLPPVPLTPAERLGNPSGAASQIQVAAAIGPNYFVAHISSDGITLYFDVFDAQDNLLSEKPFTSVVTPPGYAGSANESFESVALADLNGDGKLDLIAVLDTPLAADIAYGGVWTFLGNGDGTFQPGNRQVLTSRSLLVAAISATIGDLNGDGKPDLVLAAPLSGQLNVFLGNGDGSFQTKPLPVTIPADWGNLISVALADLNGDGHTDLVLSPYQNSSVAIALGNGDGTFQTAVLHAALFPGRWNVAAAMVTIGDLNGDGIPDIVTSGGTILFGDGKGGVASRADYGPNFTAVPFSQFLDTGGGLVSQGASVMLADFDGDGKTDILFGAGNPTYLSGSASFPTLTVLFGAGADVFTAAPVSAVPLAGASFTYSGPIAPPLGEALLPGDFNRDGIADLMHVTFAQTADDAGNVELTLLQGRGNGQFSPAATQTFAHAGNFLLESAITADFNHDGKPDLAVLLHEYPNSEVQIYLGKGDGTFAAPLVLSGPGPNINVFSLAAPDLNGDGIPDLAVISDESVAVYLGKGDGTFGSPLLTPTSAYPAVAFGDFTGDGKLDMAVAAANSALSIFPGKGDGTFSNAILTMLPSPAAGYSGNILAADFNGDGKLDLAVSLGKRVAIFLGRGDGSFTTAPPSAGAMLSLAVADINGDKIPDLIGFVNSTSPLPQVSGNLSVRLGNGDGTFQSDSITLGLSSFFTIGDFNRDGSPDIAALYGGGVLTLLNYSQPAAPLTVVSAATYSAGPLAPGAIAAAFGEGILVSGQSQSGTQPLPMSLLGISVTVQDSAGVSRQAPLYFVSPTQINFLVPAATAAGLATVTVNGATSGKPLSAQVQITDAAPALFSVGSGIAAAYAIQVAPGGVQTIEPVFTVQSGSVVATPLDLTQPGLLYLTLFGTGFDAAAATSVAATVQGVSVPVIYAGPQGSYAGLDQINLLLPQSLAGAGVASVSVAVVGQRSNIIFVTIGM